MAKREEEGGRGRKREARKKMVSKTNKIRKGEKQKNKEERKEERINGNVQRDPRICFWGIICDES